MKRPTYDESQFQNQSGQPESLESDQSGLHKNATDTDLMPPPRPPPPRQPAPAPSPAPSPWATPKTPYSPASAHLQAPPTPPPATPKYTHGFEFNFPALPTPQRQTSFRRGEGYVENQIQSPAQPSTSSARPQRHRELPARLRDPNQLVELPGQAPPAELTQALELIKNETDQGWRIADNKASRRRLKAVNAIKTRRDLIKLIAKYRRHAEPEPKWSTQEWINFIHHGDPQHTAPPYRFYRTVEIDLSPPAPAPAAADPAPAPAPAPVPDPAPVINQHFDAPIAHESDDSDSDDARSPTPTAPVESETDSVDTPNSDTETDVSAQAWGTPSASPDSSPVSGSRRTSPRPSAPPDPDGSPPGTSGTSTRPTSSTASASCPPTTSGTSGTGRRSIPIATTPAQDAAGVLRRKEGMSTVSYVPESVAKPSMADRLEGLRRNEPPRFATRRRLEREGLVLPDDILHEYLPTRKPRKK